MIGPEESAREAWGPDLPDWVLALAQACAASSQNRVAKELGRSSSLVSNVLRRKYPGDLGAVEVLVRGKFMQASVECPAQGSLPVDQCRFWRHQHRNFDSTDLRNVQQRTRMYRACARCPLNNGEVSHGKV